jgi:hypothetical protein
MRTVGIWVSSLLASTIPFIFVGAVIAFGACVFDAEGEHALTSRPGASFQAEAAKPKRVFVADADASRQPGKHVHDTRRHHQARPPRQSRFHSRAIAPFEFSFWPFANHRVRI